MAFGTVRPSILLLITCRRSSLAAKVYSGRNVTLVLGRGPISWNKHWSASSQRHLRISALLIAAEELLQRSDVVLSTVPMAIPSNNEIDLERAANQVRAVLHANQGALVHRNHPFHREPLFIEYFNKSLIKNEHSPLSSDNVDIFSPQAK